MTVSRHEVRTIEPERTEAFEDRTWPVYIALSILCAYTIGIIAATLRFDDRSPLHSAMTWTVVTIVVTGLLMLVAGWLNQRWLRRGLLLSLILSMIVNISIMVVLSLMYLAQPPVVALLETPKKLDEQNEPQTRPEFFPVDFEGEDRPMLDFQKPVLTGEPDRAQSDLVQKTTVAADIEQTATELNAQQDARRPSPIERAKPVESAPRSFESQSRLSRQQRTSQPSLSIPMVENMPSPASVQPQELQPAPADVQRQVVDATDTRAIDSAAESSAEREATGRPISRRQQGERPRIADTAQPTARRPVADPSRAPRATVAVGRRPTVSRATDAETPQPANVLTRRQRTTTPEHTAELSRLIPDGTIQAAPSRRRRQPHDEALQLADVVESATERRQTLTTQPSPIETNAVPTESTSPVARSEIRPADAQVARQSARVLQADPVSGAMADASASGDVPSNASEIARSENTNREPSPQSDDSVEVQMPRRAVARALAAVSPRAESTQQTSTAVETSGDARAAPARTAISKASEGIIGQGSEPNLDRGQAAGQTPVTVASASARRERATQETRIGPAIAPQAGARVPRSVAGADAPTTNLQAQSHPSADYLHAATLAETQANSAAGLTQRQANAPQASETAQPGQADVDLGPVRTASNDGQRRPGGGGQPRVVQIRANESVDRQRAGGTPRPALAAPDTAQVVVTPPSQRSASSGTQAEAADGRIERQSSALSTSAGPQVDRSDPSGSIQQTDRRSEANQPTRSQSIEALNSEVATIGGGTSEPLRSASATPLPVGTEAAQIRVASADASSGDPQAIPLQSQGDVARRSTDGVYGAAVEEQVGAISNAIAQDSLPGPGAVASSRFEPSAGEGRDPSTKMPDQIGDDLPVGRVIRRQVGVRSRVEVDVPTAGTLATENAESLPPEVAPDNRVATVIRRQSGGIAVPVEAVDALGGLATHLAPNTGTRSPQAQPDSRLVADSRMRFIRRDVGGPISFDTRVAVPTQAFQTRMNRQGEEPLGGNGRPSKRTEEAIELGLVYLARQQLADGSWSLDQAGAGLNPSRAGGQPAIHSDTAATGLALLAFLGAGYHQHGENYSEVVQQGLAFLIDRQKPDGDLYLPEDENSNRSAWLYSHGIAAIALCEAYGMTQDPQLKEPAQRAVDFIVAAQNTRRGGWRYAPGVGSDTSVSGWMVMALRSAELANLEVPRSSWQLIDRWLDMAQASESRPELYRYNPLAPNNLVQGHGRRPSRTMTSVGLLMRLYTGWRRDNSNMVLGAEYLLANLPELGTERQPQRDTYYWYYATQVMFHMRGEYWEAWNRRLHPLLTSSQIQSGPLAGSWDPHLPIPDRWAAHAGRLYVTTLNLLSLEVYYRHLPIYEDTAR